MGNHEFNGEHVSLREYIDALIVGALSPGARSEPGRQRPGQRADVVHPGQGAALLLQRARTSSSLSEPWRELAAAVQAQKDAVIKAELATEKRFEGVNEWRAQSADRERSQADERAKLQSSFLLKEVADNQFDQIRASSDSRYEVIRSDLSALTARIDTMTGQDQGVETARRRSDAFRTLLVRGLRRRHSRPPDESSCTTAIVTAPVSTGK